jgi:hypothetical protein
MDLEHICQITGIIMIVGSLFLIFKEKVFIDKESKAMYVELPMIGRLRTNAPLLAVIALGLVAVIYPVFRDHVTYITVHGYIKSNSHPVSVYAVAGQSTSGNDNNLVIAIPKLPSQDYQPHLVFRVGNVFDDETIELNKVKNGVFELNGVNLVDSSRVPDLKPIDTPKPAEFQ